MSIDPIELHQEHPREPSDDVLSADDRFLVESRDLSLYYGETQALFDVNIKIPEHKVTAFIGPSGCGKSTLLRSMNRLNDLIGGVRIEGTVLVNGEDIYQPGFDVISLRISQQRDWYHTQRQYWIIKKFYKIICIFITKNYLRLITLK